MFSHTMKYIVVKDYNVGNGMKFNCAFVFQDVIPHDNFARDLGVKKENILGAGFVEFGQFNDGTKVHCYGESIGLHIRSRGEFDRRLIEGEKEW